MKWPLVAAFALGLALSAAHAQVGQVPLFVGGASASLQISSASLDTTGTVLTAHMTGVQGSLVVPSALSNATAHASSSTTYAIGTSTGSGSTLTINLAGYALSSETVTLDLLASSNLTDTAGDTVKGQIGVAVTNNSTQTATAFSWPNSKFYFWGPQLTGDISTRNYVGFASSANASIGDFLETETVGSAARVLVLSFPTAAVSTTVDGGSPSTPYLSAGRFVWTWLTIYSGLSDAAHHVTVAAPYFDQTTLLSVTGSSPALQTIPGYGSSYYTTDSGFVTNTITDDYWSTQTVDGNSTLQWAFPDGAIRFNATITDLYLFQNNDSGIWSLYQDGVQVGTINTDNQQNFSLLHVASGLSGAHAYRLVTGTVNQTSYLSQMMLAGTGFTARTASAIGVEAFFGDSITAGQGLGTGGDGRQTDMWQVASGVGRISYRAGVSGQTIEYALAHTAQITGVSPLPDRVWVRYGHNNIGGTVGSVGEPNTITGDYYTMISNLRSASGMGNVPMVMEEIFPTTTGLAGQRDAANAGIAVAVNTWIANDSDINMRLVNTDNWIVPATDTIDGVHPNAVGYTKMYNREIPLAAATGYTSGGPSSGVHGSPSTNFTVAIASGATFTGDQTITIADGSAGGTITPSVGSPGTGSVTVTPTNGATSFTFTYTASTSGAKTLTITNGQSWFDATPLGYTAS